MIALRDLVWAQETRLWKDKERCGALPRPNFSRCRKIYRTSCGSVILAISLQNRLYLTTSEDMSFAAEVQTAAAVHKSGGAP